MRKTLNRVSLAVTLLGASSAGYLFSAEIPVSDLAKRHNSAHYEVIDPKNYPTVLENEQLYRSLQEKNRFVKENKNHPEVVQYNSEIYKRMKLFFGSVFATGLGVAGLYATRKYD